MYGQLRLTALLLTGVFLVACSTSRTPRPPARVVPTAMPAGVPPSVASRASTDSAPASCAPTPAPTPNPVPHPATATTPAVFLIAWGSCGSRSSLRPLDPLTGLPLEDYAPIRLGQAANWWLSPDGSLLAGALAATQSSGFTLHVYSVNPWQERFALAQPTGDLSVA